MSEPSDRDIDGLVGPEAVDWLFERRDGGHFFDGALMGVSAAFGGATRVAAFAPFGIDAEPSEFFFAVEGRLDRVRDLRRLLEAHVILARQADVMRNAVGRRRRRRASHPFARFHLVMEPTPPAPVWVDETMVAWLRR